MSEFVDEVVPSELLLDLVNDLLAYTPRESSRALLESLKRRAEQSKTVKLSADQIRYLDVMARRLALIIDHTYPTTLH